MRKLGFYRILSLLLFPVGVAFGFFALLMLMVALANPQILLMVFAIACVSIYVFSSLTFLNRGIMRAQPCKRGLRDLVKVNAIVTSIFSALMLFQVIVLIFNPGLAMKAVEQAIAAQPGTSGQTPGALAAMLNAVIYLLGVIAALLLVHIILTFRLLKQYRHVFEDTPATGDH